MKVFSVLCCVAFLFGCGADDGHESESLADEACTHTRSGPYVNIEASTAPAGLGDATHAHTGVVISLTPTTGGNGGMVTLKADEAADYMLFLSADLPLVVRDAANAEVGIEESAAVTECDEVAVKHVVEMQKGTYTLEFGPTTETKVTLVVEAQSSEHDHDH